MSTKSINILVYAHWFGMAEPKKIGVLNAQQAKGKKAFSFEYDKNWINSKEQILLDPDISWYGGQQYPNNKENFGVFLDSMPDTWGKRLMQRRAAQIAKENNKVAIHLYDIDYLLGVYDENRMGALRFKLDENGPFLDDNKDSPTPPWSSVRELQNAAEILETEEDIKKIKKQLAILLAPGSSLGGARPKANILDEHGDLWIAKFPSKGDINDKAAWEFLTYRLAIESGIEMAASKIEIVSGKYHCFFTKRFDRHQGKRIHFASAMTMTGKNEDILKDSTASYLDIAEFIQFHGASNKKDLLQLWRRIVFNIAISNTDDHLRNHGFILLEDGWHLSPAYDINPSIEKNGLSINIDTNNNALEFDLAFSVGEYFQLSESEMNTIYGEIKNVVKKWKVLAKQIGISRAEQELMESSFRF